jgi:hypothetical protein
MVTIERIGTDVCALTAKEAEGVYCKFLDGSFEGFLSWKSFRQLLQMKSNQKSAEKE